MAAHNELGKWGEDLAAAYLQEKGYEILERTNAIARALDNVVDTI